MTLDDAVKVLNEFEHQTKPGWHWQAENGHALLTTVNDSDVCRCVLPFEAIAVAREYQRVACRDYPETRSLLGLFAGNLSLSERLSWEEYLSDSEDHIRDAINEWNERP